MNHLTTQNPKQMVTTLWPLGWRWKVGCLLGGGGLSGGGCCIKIVGKSMGCFTGLLPHIQLIFYNNKKRNFSVLTIILNGNSGWEWFVYHLVHLLTFLHFSPISTKSTNKLSVFITYEDNFFVGFVNMGGRWELLQDLHQIPLHNCALKAKKISYR